MENTTSLSADGLFKDVYASKIDKLTPDASFIHKLIPFSKQDALGGQYVSSVTLTRYHGVTYYQNSDGAASLRAPISLINKPARVEGFNVMNRATISNELYARISNGDKSAFANATKMPVEELLDSTVYRFENSALYGGSGIAAVTEAGNLSQVGAEIELQVNPQDWASLTWAGAENASIQFVDRQTNTPILNPFLVESALGEVIDMENKVVRLTETVGGDAALLNTAVAALVAGEFIDFYFETSFGNEMVGLYSIMNNDATLFNIDASQYSQWKSNVFDVNGDLTFDAMNKGLMRAVGRGLINQDVDLLVTPQAWGILNEQLAQLRMFDSSYKEEGINGFKSIKYYSSNGSITVHSCGYLKLGHAMMFPRKDIKRVGSSDIEFMRSTVGGNDVYFDVLEDRAGFQFRTYYNQGIYIKRPARSVLFTNVITTGA